MGKKDHTVLLKEKNDDDKKNGFKLQARKLKANDCYMVDIFIVQQLGIWKYI